MEPDTSLDGQIRDSFNMRMLRGHSQLYAIRDMAELYMMDEEEIKESLERTKDQDIY